MIGGFDRDVEGREMGTEFEPRVAGCFGNRDRFRRDAGPDVAAPGLPQPPEHTRRDAREQRRIMMRVGQLERLVRRRDPALGVRRPDEALGQQREQPGVGRGIGLVCDRDRRLDGREILGCTRIDAHEAVVRRERGPDEQVVRAAAAGEVGTLRERVLCLRVAGPELRLAEPHEQIGAFGVGTMHRDRHVERDAVVVRRLGRCELFERLIAGERRPPLGRVGPAGPCTMPRELDHDVGPDVVGALFERAGRLSVQADAKRSAQVGVQRVGDERVHEPRRSPHRPGVDQETGARRGIERFDHDRLRKPDHVDEHVFGELDAEHRRRGQDARRIGTERVDPAPHDVAQARRYIFLTRGRQVDAVTPASSKRPDSTQCRMSCDA